MSGSVAGFHDFLAIVVAASVANMMGAFQFTAIRAFLMNGCAQGIMRAAHVSAGF